MPIPQHAPPTIPTAPAPLPAAAVPRRSADISTRSAGIASGGISGLLKARPNAPFFLVHHVESWEVRSEGLEASTWLPEMFCSWVIPGVNGYRTRPRNMPQEIAFEEAHRKLIRKGCVIVPWGAALVRHDDGRITNYIIEADARDPRPPHREGLYYMDAWDLPRNVRQGKRIKFRRDFVGYNRWRLFLVEAGILPSPDPDLVGPTSELVERAEYHLDRKASKVQVAEELREKEVAAQTIKVDRLKSARIPARRRELVGLDTPPVGYLGFGKLDTGDTDE